MFHGGLIQVLILQLLKSQYYKNIKTLRLLYYTMKLAKIIFSYNSHEVSLCGVCIYSLYVDATVVLAQYVLSLSVCRAV